MMKKVGLKKNYIIMAVLVVCCFMVFGICMKSVTIASSEKETKRDIYSYLDAKNVNYSYADVNDKLLTVELNSYGTDVCTLDDVKAIQAVFEAVHADNIIGDVEDVSIFVYDTEGNLIYDLYKPEVAEPIENTFTASAIAAYRGLTTKESVQLIVEDSSFAVKDLNFVSAHQIEGCKLELSVESEVASFDDLQMLYRKLEAYSMASGEISQCTISVEKNSECILYMAGDFEYGNCIAWISPEMHNQMTP